MTILVGPDTKIICQGITGRTASYHIGRFIAYGTNVVGGVRPGKGGTRHLDLPVFNTVASAMQETGADATLIFVPAANAADAMIEAIEAEIPLAVCVTERVPVLDMVKVKNVLSGTLTRLIGPNSQGILAPGICQIGVMSTVHAHPGSVGIVSRSASLTSEIVAQTSDAGLGQSMTIGIGGDSVHGMGFVDCLKLLIADDDTKSIVLIGEIGGSEEEEAAAFLAANKTAKPVVALIAGVHAPSERRMGHAGTLSAFGRGDAASKIKALKSAGVIISSDAASVGQTLSDALSR
jgi:succinyl-CoA synthetase alpha subunit